MYSPSNAYTLATIFSLYGPSSLSAQRMAPDVILCSGSRVQRPSLRQGFRPLELRQLLQHGCWSSQLGYDPTFSLIVETFSFSSPGAGSCDGELNVVGW